MRRPAILFLLFCACASRPARVANPGPLPPPVVPVAVPIAAEPPDAGAPLAEDDSAEGEDDEADGGEPEATFNPENESHVVAAPGDGGAPRYTADLSEGALEEQWKNDLKALGSISMGFADEGRLINGVQVPEGDAWVRVSPEKAWGTQETIDQCIAAIRRVRELHPDAPPLRINNISGPEGGYLRPHHSHQSGRDVDLGFYYPTVEPIRTRQRERVIDVKLNWELVKAIATRTDVEFILVDRRVQRVLYDYAVSIGEDRKWLDSLFNNGMSSLLFHARGHRDHFHVRFYNPRAQELGRRVAPLLAQRPDENRLIHRVHAGDTLSALAHRYGSSVAAIMKVNGMAGTMLHLSQVLQIPLRKPCTQCPVPAPVVVPPRRLPPATVAETATTAPPAPADRP